MQTTTNGIVTNASMNKNNNGYFYFSSIALILFSFYVSTQSWLFSLIIKNNIFQLGILLIIIVLLIFKRTKQRTIYVTYTRIDLLWSIAVIYISIAISQFGILENNDLIFAYILGLIFLILCKVDIKRFMPALKLFKYGSIVYVFSIIFHYLYTDLYHSIVFPFVSLSVQQRMLELVNMGYYPGLGFAQPSMAAGPLLIGLGLSIATTISSKRSLKTKEIIMIIIFFVSLIMTGKRSILLWAILTTMVTYYFSGGSKRKFNRILLIFITSIVSIFIFFITISYFDEVPFFTRIIDTINGLIIGEDVTSGRTVLYERAWEIFKENPIFGVGWGQFLVVTSGQLLSRDLSVHNVYLQLLAEQGLVGTFLILTPFIYTYIRTFKSLVAVADMGLSNRNWRTGVTFSFFYQTFFLFYCISENPFYNVYYMFVYFFSVSIIISFLTMSSIHQKLNVRE